MQRRLTAFAEQRSGDLGLIPPTPTLGCIVSIATATPTRTCRACKRELPPDAFKRDKTGRDGLHPRCRDCVKRRRRSYSNPDSVAAVDRIVDRAPDAAPARRMREELQRHRAAGRAWRAAWPRALRTVLDELPLAERASWRSVFTATRAAWQGSYTALPWPIVQKPLFIPDERSAA